MSSLQSKQMKCPQGFNFLKDATSSLKQTGQGSRFVIFVFSSCILVGSVRFIFVLFVELKRQEKSFSIFSGEPIQGTCGSPGRPLPFMMRT
jgi:hypothetical protein